jgi:hypothetical protein
LFWLLGTDSTRRTAPGDTAPSENVEKLAQALPAVVTWILPINESFDLTKAVVLEMSA